MQAARRALAWSALAILTGGPFAVAAASPLLAYRSPVYVAAGLAGVAAMALLLVQPLLAANALPGLRGMRARRWHRVTGTALVGLVALHVAGLWVTSPPDVVDALLFVSPTPFSLWGVLAMWLLLAAAALAALRRRLPLSWQRWRTLHTGLAVLVVVGSVAHAMLIEGTMGTGSKTLLCVAALGASVLAVRRVRAVR